MGPWFSLGHCDPTSGHISNPRVPYERYGCHLSKDTFCFNVGCVVWSQSIVKVKYFLTFFWKSEFFTFCWKQIFNIFFSKCSHWKTIYWKFKKPTANSHKYSKFSNAERSSRKYWAICELFKFKVLALCGWHTNEVICPYPLASPCFSILLLSFWRVMHIDDMYYTSATHITKITVSTMMRVESCCDVSSVVHFQGFLFFPFTWHKNLTIVWCC